jgi:hypothetical protein
MHIVSLDERLEGLILPSKFVGVLAMGRPVLWIGAADGEVGSLVRAFGCGVTVPSGDAVALTHVLRELSDDHANGGTRLRAMAQQALCALAQSLSGAGCARCLGKDDRAVRPPQATTCVIRFDSKSDLF